MWDTLWTDIHVATADPARISTLDGYGCIRDAALGIKNGRISWIGTATDLPDTPQKLAQDVRSGQGFWMTPGLVDAHTHVIYAGDRSSEFAERLNGATYAEIAQRGGGILSTVNATRRATEEELLDVTARRVQRMMSEGTTTIEMKSGYGLTLKDELKQLRVARTIGKTLPVRVHATFLGAHALPPEFRDRQDDYVSHLIAEILPLAAEENLIDSLDGFCETIAFTPNQIERLFRAAADLEIPVRLHSEQLSNSGGTKLAARYGALSTDHLEYVTEDDVMELAHSGTVAMLLPGAFYFIRETHLPPVSLFRKHRVPMGLATDCNPGTSPSVSLTGIMNMACTLFRMTPEEAFAAVTRIGAQALGLQNLTGSLSLGKAADMLLWDIAGPHELSYWIGGRRPVHRIFDGKLSKSPFGNSGISGST
ncbi:imidazolonepropionase [Gluconobacter kanchanaburiensis]|uniref:Imidazolonepropionase n=1 Tax=Gluconobacter kanchanaburiensis NBRC 103587 TaxID=1307948 RepID=A0A511B7D7_9PROT|nr:imidazolonepropionase [Gluconobacter kanchanaburiensis]MBF0862264.1 imidazolonepropionase [Gluconobacter kanchanaburiensis]GBR68968.1 imidazolonepropionase [Gluconobacter kanchanaburiensis NBRC 103587]GEK96254.1 imidazolonepropionase [Gluconobacter kanchanaburiensis NBRC 103587]